MVSIIVPVHNARLFIEDTIANIKAQTYKDWELILVENGSVDGTEEYLKELAAAGGDPRIKVITREDIPGRAAGARNLGLENAGGRYIAFLDADDIWLPGKLEREMQVMAEYGCGFVFCSYEFGDSNGKGTGRYVHVPDRLSFKEALSRTVIFTSTTLFDTEIIDRELLRMPDIGSEDTATWWNILKTGVVARGIDEVMVIYRRPKQSLSSNKLLAIKRMWVLLRKIGNQNIFMSFFYLCGWAVRATLRRI